MHERGDELELEIELVVVAGVCPACGGSRAEVKERSLVRVRDLPLVGRRTTPCWRKRRLRCRACGRSFSEQHAQLSTRQRVTKRSRRHLFVRVRGGAAHSEVAREERTTRYQVAVARAF